MVARLAPAYHEELEDYSQEQVLTNLRESFGIVSKTKPICRIRFDGNFVRTRSGKSAWNGRGPAKNALHNHMNSAFHGLSTADTRLLTHQLLTDKTIQIIVEETSRDPI